MQVLNHIIIAGQRPAAHSQEGGQGRAGRGQASDAAAYLVWWRSRQSWSGVGGCWIPGSRVIWDRQGIGTTSFSYQADPQPCAEASKLGGYRCRRRRHAAKHPPPAMPQCTRHLPRLAAAPGTCALPGSPGGLPLSADDVGGVNALLLGVGRGVGNGVAGRGAALLWARRHAQRPAGGGRGAASGKGVNVRTSCRGLSGGLTGANEACNTPDKDGVQVPGSSCWKDAMNCPRSPRSARPRTAPEQRMG